MSPLGIPELLATSRGKVLVFASGLVATVALVWTMGALGRFPSMGLVALASVPTWIAFFAAGALVTRRSGAGVVVGTAAYLLAGLLYLSVSPFAPTAATGWVLKAAFWPFFALWLDVGCAMDALDC